MDFFSPTLKKRAPMLLLLLLLLQVPLFSITLSDRVLESPLEVVVTQLCRPLWLPAPLLAAIVYPAHLARHVIALATSAPSGPAFHLPPLSSALSPYLSVHPNEPIDLSDPSGMPLLRLELVVGCYFSIGGAIAALFRPARMPLLGFLLLLWGLMRPVLMPHTYPDPMRIQPPTVQAAFFVGLLLSFVCVPLDKKKPVIREATTLRVGKKAN